MSFQAGEGHMVPSTAASPAGWVLGSVPSPPQRFLQWWGSHPDPAPCGFVSKAGVFVGWSGDCMGRCNRSHACFSPEGSAVMHGAALLSHGFTSGYTQGLEHKRPLASMKRLYKCSLIIWEISDQSHPSEVIAVGHWQSACV